MIFGFDNVKESDTIAVRSNGTDLVYLACLRLIAATTQRAERDAEAGSEEARAWLAWLRDEDDGNDGQRELQGTVPDGRGDRSGIVSVNHHRHGMRCILSPGQEIPLQ